MDVFEAHKYLDPTTFDDQSFLSFSSFADLTHSSLDELSSFAAPSKLEPSSGKPSLSAPARRQPTTQTKSYTAPSHVEGSVSPPPYSHSDADSESPSDFHHVPSSWTPLTPAINDFGIFHSPSSPNAVSGPSRLSYPSTTPSHQYVSHRSSSSSDWNSPVTPSLTTKSSIDSLASFAPVPDFFLPPSSSHSAFGWDDQSLGSSSTASAAPRSPPSPSPHRVASNPVLGPHRHPRSVKQVTSMPALREEGQTLSETLCQEFDLDGMAAAFGFTPMDSFLSSSNHPQSVTFMRDSPDDGANEMFLNLVADFDGFGTGDPADPFSSQGTSPVGGSADAQAQITPAVSSSTTMAQPLETNVVLEPTLAPVVAEDSKSAWEQDLSFDFSSVDFSGLIDFEQLLEPEVGVVRPSTVFTNAPVDARPVTAPEPSGSLGVPHTGMLRSVSSDAVFPVKNNTSLPTFTPQSYSYSSPTPNAMYGNPSADPEAWGMTSSRPAELPSPPVMSRRTSQPLSVHVPPASAYTVPPHGYYAPAPQSHPFAPTPGPGFTSQPPPKLPRGQGFGMKRVGSQPLPGSKAQVGMQINYYQPSLRPPEHSEEERQRIRAEVQARKVSMAEASVMQPYVPPPPPPEHMFDAYPLSGTYHPLQQPQQQHMYPQPMPQHGITGWNAPDLQAQAPAPVQPYPQPFPPQHYAHPTPYSASGSVLTTAPLINVHPPATGFYPTSTALPHARTASAPVHRVHPPPHPGPSRPIARMPSSPRARAASAATGPGSTPKQSKLRASPGRKRVVPSGGVDKWEGSNMGMFATTFVNYTPLDGQALLAGVAPSGSQSKRKRERDESGPSTLGSLMAPAMTASEGSGSGDESRSKRSRSSASSSPA